MLNKKELKSFLEEKFNQYNIPKFIETDPIQIPHKFSKKENIEIAAFLTSTIAWGKRSIIIKSASKMMDLLQNDPYEYIMNSNEDDFDFTDKFVHRTFNTVDLKFFLTSLKNIYKTHGGLEQLFLKGYKIDNTIFSAVNYFRTIFFEIPHEKRTEKHIADVNKKSAAKRINLFLMWMIRNDKSGVHFGLWNKIPPSKLKLPLDVHSSKTARMLGLLKRKQNDWLAVEEVTHKLVEFDPQDPVKFDFALFGLGVFENFTK